MLALGGRSSFVCSVSYHLERSRRVARLGKGAIYCKTHYFLETYGPRPYPDGLGPVDAPVVRMSLGYSAGTGVDVAAHSVQTSTSSYGEDASGLRLTAAGGGRRRRYRAAVWSRKTAAYPP